MLAVTETGSRYRFNADFTLVRREGSHGLRRDDEWLNLLAPAKVVVGAPIVMLLEPLGRGDATIRTTSRVLEVWPSVVLDERIVDCACGETHETMPRIDIGFGDTEPHYVDGVCRTHKRHIPCRRCG